MPHFESNALTVLLLQLAAVLALSRALGWGLRRMGQPLVIGEVLAGIVLGPSLLGLLWPEAQRALFPAESLALLRMFSQFGLVLFMFLVGLEMDARLLAGRAGLAISVSLSGIVLPFALGVALAIWLHPRYGVPGVPLLSLQLFMGVALSITAFPVLARILSEQGLLGTRLGTVSVAAAAVGDAAAWCLLAFVVAAVRLKGFSQALWSAGLAGLYVSVMLLAVRPLLGRLGRRVAGPEGLTPSITVGAFLLLMLSAWITENIGLHALFGAFLIGAVLPKQGGLATALAGRIEPVAAMLLLPLFFAYSGLRTEIAVLHSAEQWVTALAIIGVATFAKVAASAAAARVFGLSWRESTAVGVVMNTRGLMELIVLNIGLDLGVISPELFTAIVIMALVTTVITAPLLRVIYPASLRPIREPAREPDSAPALASALPAEPPYRLLLCVSDARTGPALATLAAALAHPASGSREVTALHLARPSDRPSAELRPGGAGLDPLVPLLERAAQLGLPIRPLTFVSPAPGEDILRTAGALRADLVMLGGHRPLLAEGRLGGVVRDVMARSASPVAVLIDQGFTEPRRVLVPYAGGQQEWLALALARRLAAQPSTTVTLLHAVRPGSPDSTGEGRRRIAETIERGSETRLGNVTLKIVEHDSPESASLEEAARGYDLVIAAIAPDLQPVWHGLAFRRRQLLTDCPVSLLLVRPTASPE